MGSLQGNVPEPRQPKRCLFSSAGLTKVWGHQHSENHLLCQHLLRTLCDFYHFLQPPQTPTSSHSTRRFLCVGMGMW